MGNTVEWTILGSPSHDVGNNSLSVRRRAATASLLQNLICLLGKMSHRRRWQLAGVFCLTLLGAAAEIASLGAIIPFLAVLSGPTQPACKVPFVPCQMTLADASLAFGAIVVAAAVVRVVLLYASNRFTFALGADIGNDIYRRVLFQPYQYHVGRNTSEVIAGINKVNLLVQQVINPLTQGVVSLVIATAIFVTLFHVDASTASGAMVVFAMLYFMASMLARRRLRANSRIIAERESRRIQAIQEGLGGIRDVIIDNTQMIYVKRFSTLNAEQRRAQATNAYVRTAPRYAIEGLGMLLMVGLAWWIAQKSSLADAVPILGAMALGAQKLLPQLQQMYGAWASVSGNHAALVDVLTLLDNEVPREYARQFPCADGANETPNDPGIALIVIRDLFFRYSPQGATVLEGVDLTIAAGERVGFVGSTGSGKSTLIDLIMGLLEPSQGSIIIEGRELSDASRRCWQARISHVPQTIYLSDATIAENIAFGCASGAVDIERAKDAARTAQLAEFIDSLPGGYMTRVGERGVRLSGGQRQRIGLARALYKQAKVLILDEATSALDDNTESAIMESIGSLGKGITVLMIAHRVSTLANCDRIVELEGGQIRRICSYQDMMRGRSQ